MGAIEPLICPNCGADLDVPEGVTVLKCRYCSSALRLKETDSVRALALLDAKLEDVVAHTSRTADGMAEVSYQLQSQARDQRVRERARIAQWETNRNKLLSEQKRAGNGCAVVATLGVLWAIGMYALFASPLGANLFDARGGVGIATVLFGLVLPFVLAGLASSYSKKGKDAKEKLAAWELQRPH